MADRRLRTQFGRMLRFFRWRLSGLFLSKRHVDYGIDMGTDSFLAPPRRLEGAQFISIGSRTRIGKESWLAAYDSYHNQKFTPRLIIGNDVSIGDFACITCISTLTIGDGCLFSEYVYISDHAHGINPGEGLLLEQSLNSKGYVSIGNHTFIGYRACILPGVVLGKYCVVGANSVVTRSYPDYSMVAGVPARLIKRYSMTQKIWLPVD